MSPIEHALVVAAHPDDEVLGVGGTIPLIRATGAMVTVVIVTDGSSTQYPGDEAIARRKGLQVEEANAVLGTDEVVSLDFPDMRLETVEHHRLNRALEEVIRGRSIDTVFVHHEHDVNQDHTSIFRSMRVACRPFPGQPVKRLYSYFVSSSTEWGRLSGGPCFVPNVFVDIAESVDIKLEAMSRYMDELRDYPHPRSLRAIRERAAVFGSEVGFEFAEPFRLILQRGPF
jgi:LmbE family N-acetylglucosaminyl deacetylase